MATKPRAAGGAGRDSGSDAPWKTEFLKWAQAEFDHNVGRTEAIAHQCRILREWNPDQKTLHALAKECGEKFGGRFPEMSEATFQERMKIGAVYSEEDDWNYDLSYSAHKVAARIEDPNARARVIREAKPGTTADDMKEMVKRVKRRLGEGKKPPPLRRTNKNIRVSGERNLNWRGAVVLRDYAIDEGFLDTFQLRVEIVKGRVTINADSTAPMGELRWVPIGDDDLRFEGTIDLDTDVVIEDDEDGEDEAGEE